MLRIRKFGENRSGYNAALLELLVLFCAASPESIFAKVMPRLERIAAVSALEDHAGDAALAKPIVAEVDDKPERKVHQLHVGKQLCLVPNHVDLLLVEGLAFDDQATVDEAVDLQLLLEGKTTAVDADLGKNRLWRSPRSNDMSDVLQIVDIGAGVVATTVLAKSAYAKHLRSNSISYEV